MLAVNSKSEVRKPLNANKAEWSQPMQVFGITVKVFKGDSKLENTIKHHFRETLKFNPDIAGI